MLLKQSIQRRKKTTNQFDLLVENLSVRFRTIKDLELLTDSEGIQNIWNYLVQIIVELNSTKCFFIGIYIPQTSKYIYEWKQEILDSNHDAFLKIEKELWKSEIHRLIRMGYVLLFHKYESFAQNVFKILDTNYGEFLDKSISLQQYAIDRFDFKVSGDWQINNFIGRINWIYKSEKYNQGYPKITHPWYMQDESRRMLYPEFEKIKIYVDDLSRDIEFMIEFVQMTFENIVLIALYRIAEDNCNNFESDANDFKKKQENRLLNIKIKIAKIIELIKAF